MPSHSTLCQHCASVIHPGIQMDPSHYVSPNAVDPTSSRLLERLGKKDPDAWRQLVRLYGPVVRYWIRRAGLNRTDLADVFQDVFLAISRNIAEFHRQPGQAKFRAWLKTITHSKVNDHFRRNGKQPVAFGGTTAMQQFDEMEGQTLEIHADDDEALAASEDSFLTQRTLSMVKSEFRERTWLSFYRCAVDGRTSQEVADELGISAVAVRKAKSRVLGRLRDAMESRCDTRGQS